MESARLAGLARPDVGSAHRTYLPVCGTHLFASLAGQDAAVEKDRAGNGQHAGIRRYISASPGTTGRPELRGARGPVATSRRDSRKANPSAGNRYQDRRYPPPSTALSGTGVAGKAVGSGQGIGSNSGAGGAVAGIQGFKKT